MNHLILIAITLVVSCMIYAVKIEPNWIEIVPINLTLPHLSSEFDGFKIVQLSDLHVSHFMTKERLQKIITLVQQQQPDLVVITGDFASKGRPFEPTLLINELSKITSHFTTLAVLGNHDHASIKEEQVRQALADGNVIDLDNQIYIINRETAKLTVAGIDDPYVGHGSISQIIGRLPETGAVILLVHEPDFVDTIAVTKKFDLQLSGHSHGGQVLIPFRGALVLPRGGKKYVAGLNKVGSTLEYTNRGIGMTGLPIRFGSRPEITVFTLHTPT